MLHLRAIGVNRPYLTSRRHVIALATMIEIGFSMQSVCSVVAAASAARVSANGRRQRLPLQCKPGIAGLDSLDENRRSVSEKARLQDQFGE